MLRSSNIITLKEFHLQFARELRLGGGDTTPYCTVLTGNNAKTHLGKTSKGAYLYLSVRAGVMGNFQYTLKRQSTWDGGFANRNAQPEMSNLHPNFAKHVQNACSCGISIMKGIVLWN